MTVTVGAQLIAGLAVAVAFGGMTFFSAVMAPLVFTKLPVGTAGAFIREVFPWYYLSIGVISALAAVLLLFASQQLAAALTIVVAFGFWYARQILMPRINSARDAGKPRLFNRLHRFSVGINLVQWVLLAAVLTSLLL